MLPTPDKVRELIYCDFDTGILTWRFRHRDLFRKDGDFNAWNQRFCGKPALNSKHVAGYLCGNILAHYVLAHRAVWAIYHGEWPVDCLDHINRVRTDNRIDNLREVSRAENQRNISSNRQASASFVGVYWNAKKSCWHAQISVDGKKTHIGYFETAIDAAKARDALAVELHGDFANLNFPRARN